MTLTLARLLDQAFFVSNFKIDDDENPVRFIHHSARKGPFSDVFCIIKRLHHIEMVGSPPKGAWSTRKIVYGRLGKCGKQEEGEQKKRTRNTNDKSQHKVPLRAGSKGGIMVTDK